MEKTQNLNRIKNQKSFHGLEFVILLTSNYKTVDVPLHPSDAKGDIEGEC